MKSISFQSTGKRLLALLLSVFLISCMVVPAFAISLPFSTAVEGGTQIGTFFVQGANSKTVLDTWREWQKSSSNVLFLAPDNSYYFFTVPNGATLNLTNSTTTTVKATWNKSISALVFSRNNDGYDFVRESVWAVNTSMEIRGIVTGTYFSGDNLSLPSLSYNYISNHVGALFIVDDIDDSGEDGGILGKIWDWIVNFFKKLGELLLSLFVPDADYFRNWFNELKNALNAKISGLTELYNALKSIFTDFEGCNCVSNSLIIKFPDNLFYRGYKGASANALTSAIPYLNALKPWFNGILCIITAIICYKRVVVIFEQ